PASATAPASTLARRISATSGPEDSSTGAADGSTATSTAGGEVGTETAPSGRGAEQPHSVVKRAVHVAWRRSMALGAAPCTKVPSKPRYARPVPGETQLGPFTIERELGRGGMGVVYAARREGREVALKVSIDDLPERDRKHFLEEAELLARISHPGVIEI